MSNIYVYDQGSKIQYKDGRLQIDTQDECTKSIPIESVDNVLLFGAVNITTNCINTLLKKGIHLTWLSKNGSFFGRLESTSNVNITKQRLQFRKSDDENFRLGISKQFIKGKTKNQRTILQRYARIARDVDISFQIKEMEREIKKIVITGDSEFTFPCGVCRQVIREFAKNPEIIIANSEDEYKVFTMDEILPHSFGPEDLSKE